MQQLCDLIMLFNPFCSHIVVKEIFAGHTLDLTVTDHHLCCCGVLESDDLLALLIRSGDDLSQLENISCFTNLLFQSISPLGRCFL